MKNAIRSIVRNGRGILAGTGIAVFSATVRAADALDPPVVVPRITAENYEWHLFALYAAAAICCVVFGVMLHSMRAHRKAATRSTGAFHRSAAVEIVWAAVPWAIIFGTAWPAAAVLSEIESPDSADITIQASGMQWKWGYRYLKGEGEGISFESNVYAPRSRAAESARPKARAIGSRSTTPSSCRSGSAFAWSWRPTTESTRGMCHPSGSSNTRFRASLRDTWFHAGETGTYRGLCSIEACGAGRACVLIVVKVVNDGDYRRWVDGRRRSMAAGIRETTVLAPALPSVDAL